MKIGIFPDFLTGKNRPEIYTAARTGHTIFQVIQPKEISMILPQTKQSELPKEAAFTDRMWNDLVDRTAGLFHFDDPRKEKMANHQVMKLVGALPFLAGCRNPYRIALSHLATYVMAASEGGKDLFLHSFADNSDLFSRLERISHFDGGDPAVIQRGMNLLALAMLEDHRKDSLEDRQNRKYNPLNAGAWDYEKMAGELKKAIASVDCPGMEQILSSGPGPDGYWDV